MDAADVRTKEELALSEFFEKNGLILCNEHPKMPYLDSAGGNWNAVVALMEHGDVFYSRFYNGRVTYLSREWYFALKLYRARRLNLPDESLRVYDFLRSAGMGNAKQIQAFCRLSKKQYDAAMLPLFREMLVTVLWRDEILSENWCTFLYGTSETWEQKRPENRPQANFGDAQTLLARYFDQTEIQRLLR